MLLATQLYATPLSLSNDSDWITSSIENDLAFLSVNPTTTQIVESYFAELCNQNYPSLYFKIRNNRLIKIKSNSPNNNRSTNPRIEALCAYFYNLSRRHALPDTDFIVSLHDAAYNESEYNSAAVPLFAFATKKQSNNVLLIPDFEMFDELNHRNKSFLIKCKTLSAQNPWTSKRALAFFRGSTTGSYDYPALPDFGNDRARAVLFSSQHPDLMDATFNAIVQQPMPIQQAIKCWLASLNKSLNTASIPEHFKYKYLLDIDGNSCTYSRCRWILLSNSTLVKVMSDHRQWYYKALKPWVHFVPLKRDLSDCVDTLNYLKENDHCAHQIALNGQDLGRTIFSQEMVDRYVLTLLNGYAKHVTISE